MKVDALAAKWHAQSIQVGACFSWHQHWLGSGFTCKSSQLWVTGPFMKVDALAAQWHAQSLGWSPGYQCPKKIMTRNKETSWTDLNCNFFVSPAPQQPIHKWCNQYARMHTHTYTKVLFLSKTLINFSPPNCLTNNTPGNVHAYSWAHT